MCEVQVLASSRERPRLKFNKGYLHFVESRCHTIGSAAPHASLGGRFLSEPARLLLNAKNEDVKSLELLIYHCAVVVLTHGLREHWKMSQGCCIDMARAEKLSELAVYPFVYGEPLDDSKSARFLGVSRSVWLNRWQARMLMVRWWIERWDREGQVC